jgi:hypothetical protein
MFSYVPCTLKVVEFCSSGVGVGVDDVNMMSTLVFVI